jgi:hypothetical protein
LKPIIDSTLVLTYISFISTAFGLFSGKIIPVYVVSGGIVFAHEVSFLIHEPRGELNIF